ncbi:hypothetical protein CYMTET_33898 [Cymbomonas tetramitiformis]|uniref:RAP domain-containing protein n=1 Tax=Cymbomonas tetramitiformis TaxID=36881 RepID=A0AAE0FCC4_9CHLO|nr:hypothetical protein CYMTET_33898 [Cymbomonas tetramitiformis]
MGSLHLCARALPPQDTLAAATDIKRCRALFQPSNSPRQGFPDGSSLSGFTYEQSHLFHLPRGTTNAHGLWHQGRRGGIEGIRRKPSHGYRRLRPLRCLSLDDSGSTIRRARGNQDARRPVGGDQQDDPCLASRPDAENDNRSAFGWAQQTQDRARALQASRRAVVEPQPPRRSAKKPTARRPRNRKAQSASVKDAEAKAPSGSGKPGAPKTSRPPPSPDPARAALGASGQSTAEAQAFSRELTASQKIPEVLELCEKAGVARISVPNVSAALQRLAQLARRRKMRRLERRMLSRGTVAADLVRRAAEAAETSAAMDRAAPVMSSRAVVTVLWSLAVMDAFQVHPKEVSALLQWAGLGAKAFNPLEVSNLTWALGTARHMPPSDLWGTLWTAEGRLSSMNGGQAAACLWGCAQLGNASSAVKEAVLQWDPVASMSAAQMLTCLWALAVLDMTSTRVFSDLWRDIGRELCAVAPGNHAGVPAYQLAQLHQARLAVVLDRPKGGGVHLDEHPEGLRFAAAASWHAQGEGLKSVSSYQVEVERTLDTMGLCGHRELLCAGYSIDIGLTARGVALEVDGPSHFLVNLPTAIGGPTQMKHRHLEAMGWKVLSVPYLEWDRLSGIGEQRVYIQQQLDAIGCGAVSETNAQG